MSLVIYLLGVAYLLGVLVSWFFPWWYVGSFHSWAKAWPSDALRDIGMSSPLQQLYFRLYTSALWPWTLSQELILDARNE